MESFQNNIIRYMGCVARTLQYIQERPGGFSIPHRAFPFHIQRSSFFSRWTAPPDWD